MSTTPTEPVTSERIVALEALIAAGLTLSECIAVFSDRQGEAEKFFIELARKQWEREGEIEIDDKTITSGSEDHGDYVLAWVWVSDPRPHPDDDEDAEGGFTFDEDYGVHANGDMDAQISARNLEVGDTFNDPAYDAPGEWHTIESLWVIDGTVHIDEEEAEHKARPDDDPAPGDRCKDCGKPITWLGPSHTDWEHVK